MFFPERFLREPDVPVSGYLRYILRFFITAIIRFKHYKKPEQDKLYSPIPFKPGRKKIKKLAAAEEAALG